MSGSPADAAADRYRIVETPLMAQTIVDRVRRDEAGAVVVFEGVVRNHSKGQAVQCLEYEAYGPMAQRVLAQIGAEIAQKWSGCESVIVHRVGKLAVGEAAVIIAISSAHRAAAFSACAYAIDRIKEDLPIWKKEITPGGEYWVGLGS